MRLDARGAARRGRGCPCAGSRAWRCRMRFRPTLCGPDPAVIPLPVDALIPDVLAGLQSANALVLAAPPGSGKSTRVPPALAKALQASGGGKVYLLQPRRIAAKALAKRI